MDDVSESQDNGQKEPAAEQNETEQDDTLPAPESEGLLPTHEDTDAETVAAGQTETQPAPEDTHPSTSQPQESTLFSPTRPPPEQTAANTPFSPTMESQATEIAESQPTYTQDMFTGQDSQINYSMSNTPRTPIVGPGSVSGGTPTPLPRGDLGRLSRQQHDLVLSASQSLAGTPGSRAGGAGTPRRALGTPSSAAGAATPQSVLGGGSVLGE
eukprot:CAMPEP_0194564268 /NCGR_PEP_ID=MMETSP0292-20121207/3990_1 /TAXON_ID=39354 /ORGANISM="Heterosigma akashiwo, Strain CCMP2393" /LENGTH=212 /DNA_ID=CAMNT_0039413361 /DNA_START=53 /DNA_END=688 /DNA_ORIENTATION=+